MAEYPYLELDSIFTDRAVMKMLPPEIAYRYHALPVATDGKKVTIAMAAPDDRAAFSAIRSVINAPVCLIQANEKDIDHKLDEFWLQFPAMMKFLFWPLTVESNLSYNIAKGFARSLTAELSRVDCPGEGQDSISELCSKITQIEPDLLIVKVDHPSKLCRKLAKGTGKQAEDGLPDLLFLPPEPALPVKKVLVVIPNNGNGSEKAGFWVIRLSMTSSVEVTILPVLPPVPLCYGSFLHHDLSSLLKGSDTLGMNLSMLSSQFNRENINANYKLREGDPFNQIRDEICYLDPDLIIMPSSCQPGREVRFCADLAGMLFKCITKPILITNQY